MNTIETIIIVITLLYVASLVRGATTSKKEKEAKRLRKLQKHCSHQFYQDKQITILRCEKCGLEGRWMGTKDLYPNDFGLPDIEYKPLER